MTHFPDLQRLKAQLHLKSHVLVDKANCYSAMGWSDANSDTGERLQDPQATPLNPQSKGFVKVLLSHLHFNREGPFYSQSGPCLNFSNMKDFFFF